MTSQWLKFRTATVAALALSLPCAELFAQGGRRGGDGGGERGKSRQSTRSESGQRRQAAPSRRAEEQAPSRRPTQAVPREGREIRPAQPTERRSYYRGPEELRDEARRNVDELRRDATETARRRADDLRRSIEGQDPRRDFERLDSDRGDFERRDRERRDIDRDDFERSRAGRDDRDRWDDRRDYWRRNADRVRGDWRDWDRDNVPFRYGWWDAYAGNWPVYSPYRYARWQGQPYYWWGWTPAARLGTWFAFNWGRPYYWSYGPGTNIYYRDNYVYYDDRRVMPADDYYTYVHGIAHNVPKVDVTTAENMDWTPLGVFVVLREGETNSNRVLQLAVNKEGVISGTYFNRDTGETHPVIGRVDEKSQRAAWAFADGQQEDVVFETSIYNLTNSETSMMVHFSSSPDDAEVWTLVRLEKPDVEVAERPTTNALP